jgi:hypothetical protein
MVLKLHGSIDWFDRTDYGRREENLAKQGFVPDSDLIFKELHNSRPFLCLRGPDFQTIPCDKCTA